ncbi:hypothetical protein DAPPUDRAFT_234122 [Daphnia pulex]|uniref:Uncharacterized protein n=1 Tax=Daphnia pulex TaxID=6669 RepID=E9FUM4_DAPPU|nr:hypothetical protein DAPPUDRAFT_234122 [Daphnia pulex]|eukprot:EFX88756.1 hypothetical protein DAPPUDRAFT_234122 [Daphnia pulex]
MSSTFSDPQDPHQIIKKAVPDSRQKKKIRRINGLDLWSRLLRTINIQSTAESQKSEKYIDVDFGGAPDRIEKQKNFAGRLGDWAEESGPSSPVYCPGQDEVVFFSSVVVEASPNEIQLMPLVIRIPQEEKEDEQQRRRTRFAFFLAFPNEPKLDMNYPETHRVQSEPGQLAIHVREYETQPKKKMNCKSFDERGNNKPRVRLSFRHVVPVTYCACVVGAVRKARGSIDVTMIRIVVFASLFGVAVVCVVAVCAFLLYRRLTSTNGASKWKPATTRIKISRVKFQPATDVSNFTRRPFPNNSNNNNNNNNRQNKRCASTFYYKTPIEWNKSPRLGGSGMSLAEMSPLMRHKPLRDSRQPSEAQQQHRMGACISSCNALATTAITQQLQMTSSSAGSRKTLVRPLSQSALYLARSPSSSQMAHHHHQQTSLTNLVGSGYVSGEGKNDMLDNQGQEPAKMDDWQRTPPHLEITLVYVSASAQLLVHIHRLSNVTPPVRCPAKESTGTQVKLHFEVDFYPETKF